MVNQLDASNNNLVLDTNNLTRLKNDAKANTPEALKETAKQFEAMLLNMMLKSMRDASPQDGVFDSEQTRTYTAMLDQQMSQHLANKGMGLADTLVKQLSKSLPNNGVPPAQVAKPSANFSQTFPYQPLNNLSKAVEADNTEAAKTPQQTTIIGLGAKPVVPAADSTTNIPNTVRLPEHIRAFGERFAGAAQQASDESGIPSHFLLGQAALESGWGKSEIKNADGSTSHNLFGIKAGGSWRGKVTEAVTTEYVNGVKEQRVEKFRAYDSYADSFKDFARLITNNPRYEQALANTDDAHAYSKGLQQGGYATDPQYAKKLTQVIALTSNLTPNNAQ